MQDKIINMTEILKQIKKFVKIELLKRGINVEVRIKQNDNKRICIETDDFQTIPCLFKKLCINNNFISHVYEITKKGKDKEIEYWDFFTELHVNWEYFNGGTNGTKLMSLRFRWFANDASKVVHLINID